MLMLPPSVRIYLAIEPTDMRKSFRGLSGLVRQRLDADPLSGHIFCFVNRRRNMLKCLVHDRTGFLIYYKKLSRGTFQFPEVSNGATRAMIDAGTLTLILGGTTRCGAPEEREAPRAPPSAVGATGRKLRF